MASGAPVAPPYDSDSEDEIAQLNEQIAQMQAELAAKKAAKAAKEAARAGKGAAQVGTAGEQGGGAGEAALVQSAMRGLLNLGAGAATAVEAAATATARAATRGSEPPVSVDVAAKRYQSYSSHGCLITSQRQCSDR